MMDDKIYVSCEWVKERLEDPNLVILDIPYGMNEFIKEKDPKKRLFEEEHLPNAIKIDKNELQDKDSELNLYDSKTLCDVFLSKGVDQNSLLVVYSDGIIASSRVALAAYWLGVKQVKIMLGGIKRWKDLDYPLTKEIVTPTPKKEFGCAVPARAKILLSTPDDVIKQQKTNPNFVLANIRSWDEFIGTRSGYPYIEGTGAPFHSVYAKASTNRVNVEYLIEEDGHFGDIQEILAEWKEWGITPDKEIAFFCGAGWRAAAVFFLMLELGWQNVKVYDGGWYQWNLYHHKSPQLYKIQIGDPKSQAGIRII